MPVYVAHPGLTMTPDLVGIVLRAGGGRVDHVLSALRDDNPGAELHVADHGENVETWASGMLHVSADTLRWHVGRGFGIAELRSLILAYRGTLSHDADHMTVISDSH